MCCEGLIEKFPQMNNCCCCKVETGSKIIAWLDMVGYTIWTVLIIIAFAGLLKDKSSGGTIAAAVILIIIGVIMCIMALVLLLGLYQEDMGKVKFWLRVVVCLFCVQILAYIMDIITTIVDKRGASAIVSSVLSAVISLIFQMYIIAVVKSHYYNMHNSFDNGRA